MSMPAFGDEEVRAAALAKIQQLREVHGGRIPRAALMEGITLHGERIPIWNYQKGIFKPAALGREGAALSVHTSIESPYEDEHDIDEGRIAYKYRGTDSLHPDNVALRRAKERQLPLLYLVAVDPGVYDVIAPVYAIDEDPGRLQFTLIADSIARRAYPEDEVTRLVRREYVTRSVLQRLHQQQFRRMVLAAYREQCAICRLRHVQLLDAAHILPDRHPKGVAAVPNGLGLCKIHHSAYDSSIIGIDADARIHVREDVLREKDGPMLKHGIQEVAGGRLILPRNPASKPNPDFLAERFERFRAA
jgi:putative restriction endonuclease